MGDNIETSSERDKRLSRERRDRWLGRQTKESLEKIKKKMWKGKMQPKHAFIVKQTTLHQPQEPVMNRIHQDRKKQDKRNIKQID